MDNLEQEVDWTSGGLWISKSDESTESLWGIRKNVNNINWDLS